MTVELDHVFVFVEAGEVLPGGPLRSRLDAMGLVPSYERRHVGQGTANLCYVFDNAYVEFLFAVDRAELALAAVARTGLSARSCWRETGASRIGIGLRGQPLPFAHWPYRFGGLPPGVSVPVAYESADIRQPFLFGSPGMSAPIRWTDGRAGERQSAAGLTSIAGVRLELSVEPCGAIKKLAELGIVDVTNSATACRGGAIELTLAKRDGGSVRLRLP